jgi:hypothetical protein
VNEVTNELNQIMLEGAVKCDMVTKIKNQNMRSKRKVNHFSWFNQECKIMKTEFEIAKRRYRNFKSEENLVSMKRASKNYKRILNQEKESEKRRFQDEIRLVLW